MHFCFELVDFFVGIISCVFSDFFFMFNFQNFVCFMLLLFCCSFVLFSFFQMKIFLATEMANLKYHFVVKQTDDVIEKVLDLGFPR